jgi:hypothetical protein
MSTTFIGTSLSEEPYGSEERAVHNTIVDQVNKKFPTNNNLVISLTWFGPQFTAHNDYWEQVISFKDKKISFDNIFLIATVDPTYLNDDGMRDIKEATNALHIYLLGNFDSPHQFSYHAPVMSKYFTRYSEDDVILTNVKHVYINYNRKPKPHRIALVNKLIEHDLLKFGNVTLGKDETKTHNENLDSPYLTLGEKHEDYVEHGNDPSIWGFGIPQDFFTLHRMDLWNSTFLYINAATVFETRDELFCQQDVFKALLGLRPFVINGVQRTYHWYRYNGFKTFNHYWNHIDIENGDVHDTLIELINYLKDMKESELMSMYNDMLPDLLHNKERFYEYAIEQRHKMEHLF